MTEYYQFSNQIIDVYHILCPKLMPQFPCQRICIDDESQYTRIVVIIAFNMLHLEDRFGCSRTSSWKIGISFVQPQDSTLIEDKDNNSHLRYYCSAVFEEA